MDLILVAVISLGAIGLIAAVILYAASKKFACLLYTSRCV